MNFHLCRRYLVQRRRTKYFCSILMVLFLITGFFFQETSFWITTGIFSAVEDDLEHDLDLDIEGELNLERYVALDPVEELRDAVPNLPPRYWLERKSDRKANGSCAKYPSLYQIKYNNGRWQTLETSNGTFHLFGAYYDSRTLVEHPTIQILAMLDRIEPQLSTFCQMWFAERKEPAFARVLQYKYIWNKTFGNYKQGIEQPYLLSCLVPSDVSSLVPESVSLVEGPCDSSTTNLRVVNDRPPEGCIKDFAVCVKGLDLPHANYTIRLIEWIEALSILGADKLFLYELHVHPNISKVLDYYQRSGFVNLTKLSLPGEQPIVPQLAHKYLKEEVGRKRLNEVIPYNDCLYRNIYSYRFVVLLDTDELIVPKKTSSWKSLMEVVSSKALKFNSKPRSSFSTRNVYFLDSMQMKHGLYNDMPRYLHHLQHVYRARNYTGPGDYAKCFHSTERVLTLHNHFPFACLGGGCYNYPISTEDAQLQHYRQDCVRELNKRCEEDFKVNPVLDTALWRYKIPLLQRTQKAIKRMGFLKQRGKPK